MESFSLGSAMSLREVELGLSALWRQAAARQDAVMRACTLNLVVPCEDPGALAQIGRVVAEFSERRPCRAIVACASAAEGAEESLRAWVSAHCRRSSGGRVVCSEQVTLEARGEQSAELVPESVLQLLSGDVPIHVWWCRSRLAGDAWFRPFARLSDRLIVGGVPVSDPSAALVALAGLAADPSFRGYAADLAWTRLAAWRTSLASLFDAACTRSLLHRLTEIRIVSAGPADARGISLEAAYLAGWLASRLSFIPGSRDARWRRPDGGEVAFCFSRDPLLLHGEIGSVRLKALDDEGTTTAIAERVEPGRDLVRLFVETSSSCPLPRVVELSTREPAVLLDRESARTGRDATFEAALSAAARIAGP